MLLEGFSAFLLKCRLSTSQEISLWILLQEETGGGMEGVSKLEEEHASYAIKAECLSLIHI